MAQVPATSQLFSTWMTGLRSSGLNTVDKLDNNTIAISGELEGNKYVIQYRNLYGDTLKNVKIGVCQVRSFRVVTVDSIQYMVVTKQDVIELRSVQSGKLVDKLKIPDFDPCALCVTGMDTLLVASWSQETPNMNETEVESTLLEIKIVSSKLKQQSRKLIVKLSSIIGVVRVFHKMTKILIMTSYNNDVIMAVDYNTGNRLWKMNELDYEGAVIRPNGIVSDQSGHVYVADTGLDYCRLFVLSSGGRIVKKLLDTAGWCDDITWINDDKRIVILHDKSGTDKQDVSVYDIVYMTRSK